MWTCLRGLWFTSVVVGKATFLACGLIVSCLMFLVDFLEVDARTKMSHRFVACGMHSSPVFGVGMLFCGFCIRNINLRTKSWVPCADQYGIVLGSRLSVVFYQLATGRRWFSVVCDQSFTVGNGFQYTSPYTGGKTGP